MITNTPLSELDELMSGALSERMAIAVSEIVQNILDPNTKPDAERRITIVMKVKPTKNRQVASVTTEVTVKQAPKQALETWVTIGLNDDGEMVMVEQTEAMEGQIDLSGNVNIPNIAQFKVAGGR